MNHEETVMLWIENNFFLDTIKIEDFDLFPHGKRLIDKNGSEMVVFFDFFKGCVDYHFPDEK